jgi:hypothetical protein
MGVGGAWYKMMTGGFLGEGIGCANHRVSSDGTPTLEFGGWGVCCMAWVVRSGGRAG